MEPYISNAEVVSGKFQLNWLLHTNPHAFFIAVGKNSDISDTTRIFVLPGHIRRCDLDLGDGSWYARVGSMVGNHNQGTILWSGVYGPHTIHTNKSVVPSIQPRFTVSHTGPISNGIRFKFASNLESYYIFETWKDDCINAKWTYYKDMGHGYANCGDIMYPTKYNIRIRDLQEIPTQHIIQLCEGILYEAQTSAKPTPILNSTDHAVVAADNVILREATFRRNVRFTSHADYLRYQAALAKSSGGKA